MISLMGPKSEALLAQLSPDDLSKAGLPFSMTAEIDVGYARVRAARMSYVGGPGYEMVVPTDQCVTLYDALCERRRALRPEGRRLLHDRRAAHRSRPPRLGSGTVAGRNAVGSRARLRGQDRQGGALHRPRRAGASNATRACASASCMFTFDDPAAFPWGGEPILMDGRNVGELTSAGYSRKHGRAIAMGYARAGADEPPLSDERILAARYEIDIAGAIFAVTPHLKLA